MAASAAVRALRQQVRAAQAAGNTLQRRAEAVERRAEQAEAGVPAAEGAQVEAVGSLREARRHKQAADDRVAALTRRLETAEAEVGRLGEQIVALSMDHKVLESERAREEAVQRRTQAHEELAALQIDQAATDYAKSVFWRMVASDPEAHALQPQQADSIRQLLGLT